MNWLARLKKLESTPAPTLQNLQKGEVTEDARAFVGFVGAYPGPFENSMPESEVIAAFENDAVTARLALFTDRGLSMDEAEAMADRLARRDHERDDRQLCLECLHLSGGASGWRCSQWRKIQIGSTAIPSDHVTVVLHRCAGFNDRLEAIA